MVTVLTMALLGACSSQADAPTHDSPTAPSIETTTDPGPSPCADGSWAGWASWEGTVWVSPDGNDEAPGTPTAPKRTIAAGLQATKGAVDSRVGLFPGEYVEHVQVKRLDGGVQTLSGCSADEVRIREVAHARDAAVRLVGPGQLTLRRVTVHDSKTAIVVRKGASGLLEDVVVENSRGRGISIVGDDTTAILRRVQVSKTQFTTRDKPQGWGVSSHGAAVVLDDVEITDSDAFGLYQHGGTLIAHDLSVSGTGGDWAGARRVGVYLNQLASVAIDRCRVTDSDGGGLYVVDSLAVAISSCTIDTVRANGTLPGDGLVVHRRSSSSIAHSAVLTGNTVTGAARLGIAIAGPLSVALSDNTADQGLHVGAQVSVTSSGTTTPLDPSLGLGRDHVGDASDLDPDTLNEP